MAYGLEGCFISLLPFVMLRDYQFSWFVNATLSTHTARAGGVAEFKSDEGLEQYCINVIFANENYDEIYSSTTND